MSHLLSSIKQAMEEELRGSHSVITIVLLRFTHAVLLIHFSHKLEIAKWNLSQIKSGAQWKSSFIILGVSVL